MSEVESNENWEKFAAINPPSFDISSVERKVGEFCKYHENQGTCIVLVTSGGTTVPLEHNTVRFVDNFSAGTRGSASAEYFLDAGYAVIFMHRKKSFEPFSRHLDSSSLLKTLKVVEEEGHDKLQVCSSVIPKLLPIIKKHQEVTEKKLLLSLPFTTVSDYLHSLHVVACVLRSVRQRALMYLAAAVSDFYIPSPDMATHKISSNEPLDLRLQIVPKLLQPLVRYWAPEAFVVSFKLETDENLLLKKAKQALEKYGHKIVIANLLHSLRTKVVMVSRESTLPIELTEDERKVGKEIEQKIVKELTSLHQNYQKI